MGGDWVTSSVDKRDLDKTIREFCKKRGWVDMSWEKRREEEIEGESEEEKGERMKKMHTWERERSGTTKRLDSFWGKRDTAEGVREVRTIQKHLIASDHWLHIIDWEVKGKLKERTRRNKK